MQASECTAVAPSWPSPSEPPFNGFNGSLHNLFFYVPSYHVNPYTGEGFSSKISWNMIDNYAQLVSVTSLQLGACMGMMLMTLLYVLFITPAAKRWKPFHSSLLAAVLLKAVSFLVLCIQTNSKSCGLQPAYPILTLDHAFSYTTTFTIWRLSGATIDVLATIATLICLFIHTRTTLAGLRLSHRPLYLCLLTYLSLASLAGSVASILVLASQAQLIRNYPRVESATLDTNTVRMGSNATIAIVLGSYCLIAAISIVHIIWTRRALLGWGRTGGDKNMRYDRALALLALVLIESAVAPLVLALLIPFDSPDAGFFRPDLLVLPIVLALLPFGGLFSGREGETMQVKQPGRRVEGQATANMLNRDAAFHTASDVGKGYGPGRSHDPGLVHLAELGADSDYRWQKPVDKPAAPQSAVDRELAALDAL